MKRKGWIGFLIGIVFCLMMVLPSFVHASLDVYGSYGGNVLRLNQENTGSSSYPFWDGTSNTDAYIEPGTEFGRLSANTDWRVFNNGGTIDNSNYAGLIFGYPNSLTAGSLYNNAGSTIAGYDGVKMGAGTITNGGLIEGYSGYGIYQYDSYGAGNFTITNGVTIPLTKSFDPETDAMTITLGTPTNYGIGRIIGNNGGIYSYIGGAGAANITNYGLIDGYYGSGIYLEGTGTATAAVTNYGAVIGGYESNYGYGGIEIYNMKSATVDNYSTIGYGGYGGFAGIEIGDVGTTTITNHEAATISGDIFGINIWGDSTTSASVTNEVNGIIEGYAANGLAFWDVGTVQVDNSGMIRGGFEGVLINGAEYGGTHLVTVNNKAGATIEGHGGYEGLAIYLDSHGGDDNSNSLPGVATTAIVNNSGTFRGDNAGVSIFGDDFTIATVNNNAGGTIEGMGNGLNMLFFRGAGVAEVNNSGTIVGYGISPDFSPGPPPAPAPGVGADDEDYFESGIGVGIVGAKTATVANTGAITGYGGNGYGGYNGDGGSDNSGTGTDDVYGGNGTNGDNAYGGSSTGLFISNSMTATVTNSGTINGYGGYGGSGGYGGYGGSASNDYSSSGSGGDVYGGNGGNGGDASGGYNAAGIYVGSLTFAIVGTSVDADVSTVSVTNSGAINGYGGNGGAGGYGGYGGAASTSNSYSGDLSWGGYAYGGYGGDGGDAYGGYGYGIYVNVGTSTVANSGTIKGLGGYGGSAGYGGYGGTASAGNSSIWWGGEAHGGNGGNGGSADGGNGYGISIEPWYFGSVAATVTNSGIINGTGGNGGSAGDGGYGGSASTGNTSDGWAGNAYGGNGGNGGSANGGNGYGVSVINGLDIFSTSEPVLDRTLTATVTNSGTINGTGGNGGSAGDGGYGGSASSSSVNSFVGEVYAGNGGTGGSANGGNGYGIYVGPYPYATGQTTIPSIVSSSIADVTNSGTINGYGGNGGYGGDGGNGGYGGYGGDAYGGDGYGIYIADADEATVTNSGTINGYGGNGGSAGNGASGNYTAGNGGDAYGGDGYGIYIVDMDTATVNNSGTITGTGGNGGSAGNGGYGGYGGSDISGGGYGIFIAGVDTATVNNSGTITGTGNYTSSYIDGSYDIGSWSRNYYFDDLNIGIDLQDLHGSYDIDSIDVDYGIGVGVAFANKAVVNNYTDGVIEGGLVGVGITFVGDAVVDNSGTITSMGHGSFDVDYASAHLDYLNLDVSSLDNITKGFGDTPTTPFFSIDIDDLDLYVNYLDADLDYGIGIGIAMANTATVINRADARIEGGLIGVGIAYVGDAVVDNSGTITGLGHGIIDVNEISGDIRYDDGEGEGGHHPGSFSQDDISAELDYGIGVGIFAADTATVINRTGASITGGSAGVAIAGVGTATVDNYGSITSMGKIDVSMPSAEDYPANINLDYGMGVGIIGVFGNSGEDEEWDTEDDVPGIATVTNHTGASITGGLIGVGIAFADQAIVTNEEGASITSMGRGTASFSPDDGVVVDVTADYGIGVGIYGPNMTNLLAETMSMLQEYAIDDGGILTIYTIPETAPTGTAKVDNYGTITGGIAGVLIGGLATAEVNNYGTITGVGTGHVTVTSEDVSATNVDEDFNYGVGIGIVNVSEATITNNTGGVISGYVGIASDGNTTIKNYGKIESTDTGVGSDSYAIYLAGVNNEVTLGTGSEIIGNIVVAEATPGYYYADNNIILDGTGTINANQITGFGSMDKTGAGTWTLMGDQDYTLTSTTARNNMPITVKKGVLALSGPVNNEGKVTGSGIVKTNSFEQKTGASLGYVVTPEGYTGRLRVTGNADFNDGAVDVIPTPTNANAYALTTTYDDVLTVGTVSGTVLNKWTDVMTNLEFLTAELVDDTDYVGTGEAYDLILHRLSFTTGADPSTTPLGQFLDELYGSTDDPDTLIWLNDILRQVHDGDGQKALAELGGGSHTAFQLMSFNGLDKYLGVLNNHMGGMGGFASNNSSIGLASSEKGTQLVMAGNGDTISDVAPMMLAAVGNVINQSQAAKKTNWGLWADGYLGTGNRRSDEIITKYKQNLFGGIIGFDYRVAGDLYLGISGGISRTKVDFDDLLDNGHMDSYHGSVYLNYNGKPWYVAGVATYAYNKYNLDRYITTIGPTQIANSDYSGNEYAGYVEVGYKIDAGNVEIRPLAAFQVDYLEQEAFTETGSDYNLDVDKQNTGSYKSFLGVNVNGTIKLSETAALKPELRLKWAHEFSNDDHMINASFDGIDSGSFLVKAEKLSRDAAIIGVGMSLLFNKHVSAYIQYDAELNSDFVNHTGLAGLRLAW